MSMLIDATPHKTPTGFDEAHVLHQLTHFLPSQTPLKDFIHHNSLHAFQDKPFYEAIFQAGAIFGYRVTLSLQEFRKLYAIGRIREGILEDRIARRKGKTQVAVWKEKLLTGRYDSSTPPRIGKVRAYWKSVYHLDLDNAVQPLLFRIIGSYLDQGVALWHFPFETQGLVGALRTLERESYGTFFKTHRARKLVLTENLTLTDLLREVVGKEAYFEQYLYDQQFGHRGWSGIVAAIEQQPHTLLYPKAVSLEDFIKLELLLEIDALTQQLGTAWQPLATHISAPPEAIFAPLPPTELHEVLALWQDAFEWTYYDEVLAGVKTLHGNKPPSLSAKAKTTVPSFQAIFCIDERECSLRRHIESVQPDCETLGCPGFFGVEFYFHPAHGKFYEKLCPAPVTPAYLIKEKESPHTRGHEILYTKKTHSFWYSFFINLPLGVLAAFKLVQNLFRPTMSPAISDAFAHMNLDGELLIENTDPTLRENGLQIGFTVSEMADRVGGLLANMGLLKDFSPLVYVVAHGSSSANNPHHGAHDCGACSGRPGSVNARVLAFMANHRGVREMLAARGLRIPDSTIFVGALHDTASDEMAFYDIPKLPNDARTLHEKYVLQFEAALDLNAKERSRRFASIDTEKPIKHVREAIKRRSVSYFEPRPELGHGTNALCFVGQRSLTKGLFLDRRAFMNSYNYLHDPDGTYLLNVMRPLPPVCGGINLEYYFSRIDNYKLGAGTKLPHNVMGLIGVANSCDGDLRAGLPLQMIEVHDPVRLLIIVEHYPEVVLSTIQRDPALYAWFEQQWVHLLAIHPDTMSFHYFENGKFLPYEPLMQAIGQAKDVHELIEKATPMLTNDTPDATLEHIPIHVIQS